MVNRVTLVLYGAYNTIVNFPRLLTDRVKCYPVQKLNPMAAYLSLQWGQISRLEAVVWGSDQWRSSLKQISRLPGPLKCFHKPLPIMVCLCTSVPFSVTVCQKNGHRRIAS
jgi:hypothetical protein